LPSREFIKHTLFRALDYPREAGLRFAAHAVVGGARLVISSARFPDILGFVS
jgi:hypothetical protein